jgi:hypothetical protein
MRYIAALPLLALVAACGVENDSNGQTTITIDRDRVENVGRDALETGEDLARGAGNVAVSTGRAIKNEVGDIDIDVDVSRNRNDAGGNTN